MEPNEFDLTGRVDGAAPPKTVGLATEVVRITKSVPRHFVILCEKPWGAWFHYQGRSLRCDYPNECRRCVSSTKKWRGYYHAIELMPTFKKEVYIELTHSAAVMIEMQLCTQPLRGTQVKIAKSAGGKHGRFVIEVLPKRVGSTTLMDAKSPEGLMNALWEINEKADLRAKPSESV